MIFWSDKGNRISKSNLTKETHRALLKNKTRHINIIYFLTKAQFSHVGAWSHTYSSISACFPVCSGMCAHVSMCLKCSTPSNVIVTEWFPCFSFPKNISSILILRDLFPPITLKPLPSARHHLPKVSQLSKTEPQLGTEAWNTCAQAKTFILGFYWLSRLIIPSARVHLLASL